MEEQGCWLKTAVEGQTLTICAGGEWTVERKVRAETNSMQAIIGAFDASLGKVLKAIVVWTHKKGEEHKPQRLRNKAK